MTRVVGGLFVLGLGHDQLPTWELPCISVKFICLAGIRSRSHFEKSYMCFRNLVCRLDSVFLRLLLLRRRDVRFPFPTVAVDVRILFKTN